MPRKPAPEPKTSLEQVVDASLGEGSDLKQRREAYEDQIKKRLISFLKKQKTGRISIEESIERLTQEGFSEEAIVYALHRAKVEYLILEIFGTDEGGEDKQYLILVDKKGDTFKSMGDQTPEKPSKTKKRRGRAKRKPKKRK